MSSSNAMKHKMEPLKITADSLPITDDTPSYRREDQHLFDTLLAQETPVAKQVKRSPDGRREQPQVQGSQPIMRIYADYFQAGDVNSSTEYMVAPASSVMPVITAPMDNSATNNVGNKSMEKAVPARQPENIPLKPTQALSGARTAARENVAMASSTLTLETAFEAIADSLSPSQALDRVTANGQGHSHSQQPSQTKTNTNILPARDGHQPTETARESIVSPDSSAITDSLNQAVQAKNNSAAPLDKGTASGQGHSYYQQLSQSKNNSNTLPTGEGHQPTKPAEPAGKSIVSPDSSPMPVINAPMAKRATNKAMDKSVADPQPDTSANKTTPDKVQSSRGAQTAPVAVQPKNAPVSPVTNSAMASLTAQHVGVPSGVRTSAAIGTQPTEPAVKSIVSQGSSPMPVINAPMANRATNKAMDKSVADPQPDTSANKTTPDKVQSSRGAQTAPVAVQPKNAPVSPVTNSAMASLTAQHVGVPSGIPSGVPSGVRTSAAKGTQPTEPAVKSIVSPGSSAMPVINAPMANRATNKAMDKSVADPQPDTSANKTASGTSPAVPSGMKNAAGENMPLKAAPLFSGERTAARENVAIASSRFSLETAFTVTADAPNISRAVQADNRTPVPSDKVTVAHHESEGVNSDSPTQITQKQPGNLPAKPAVKPADLLKISDADAPAHSSSVKKPARDEPFQEELLPASTTATEAVQQLVSARNIPIGDTILQNINSQTNDMRNLQQVLQRIVEAMLTALPSGQERIHLHLQEDILPGTSIVIERQNGALSIEIRTNHESSFTLLEAHKELLVKQLEQLHRHETIEVELFNDDSGDGESRQQRDLYEEWLEELSQ